MVTGAKRHLTKVEANRLAKALNKALEPLGFGVSEPKLVNGNAWFVDTTHPDPEEGRVGSGFFCIGLPYRKL